MVLVVVFRVDVIMVETVVFIVYVAAVALLSFLLPFLLLLLLLECRYFILCLTDGRTHPLAETRRQS